MQRIRLFRGFRRAASGDGVGLRSDPMTDFIFQSQAGKPLGETVTYCTTDRSYRPGLCGAGPSRKRSTVCLPRVGDTWNDESTVSTTKPANASSAWALLPRILRFRVLKGLIGKLSVRSDEGIWVVPSSGVHTLGVLVPLDLIYLNDKARGDSSGGAFSDVSDRAIAGAVGERAGTCCPHYIFVSDSGRRSASDLRCRGDGAVAEPHISAGDRNRLTEFREARCEDGEGLAGLAVFAGAARG